MPATETSLFKVGDVYTANINATAPVVVNQGGTSSAKTYSIIQVLFTLAVEYEKDPAKPWLNGVITICGQDIPNLKAGALRQALEIVSNSPVLQKAIKSYNKTDRVFEFHNGAVMEFKSYKDAQDAKSGKRDYLFVNEANGIMYDIFYELWMRCAVRTFLDYNPNSEFWVHEKVLVDKQFKAIRIISDHRHNPFLSPEQHDKIESIDDPELWLVYARGKTGKITGLVFRWDTCAAVPEHAKLIGYGLDFGFTNDPTTLIGVYMADGALYITELIYQRGLHLDELSTLMKEHGVGKSDNIIADSSAPGTISELQRMGWHGLDGANKGADSIKNGIDILKRYKVYITMHSLNVRKEANSYKWKVDPQTGDAMNIPVDFMNHAIDSVRYVALNLLTEAGKKLKPGSFGFRKKKK